MKQFNCDAAYWQIVLQNSKNGWSPDREPLRQGTASARPEEPYVQGRINLMGTRAARYAMRRLHAPPSREADINPNPQKGGYPAHDRGTFLTGANRDFS